MAHKNGEGGSESGRIRKLRRPASGSGYFRRIYGPAVKAFCASTWRKKILLFCLPTGTYLLSEFIIIFQIKHNPNLIYAILYKKEMFEVYSKNPAFKVCY
jgi:hypothetical protein